MQSCILPALEHPVRTTRTFILRLLLDSDDPTALRGVDAVEEHSFADAERLLALLRAEAAATAAQEAVPEAQPAASSLDHRRSP